MLNKVFPILMLSLGFVGGISVSVAYATGGIDMFADVLIDGTLTVDDGTQGLGKIFTSDGAGKGSWQDPNCIPVEVVTGIDSINYGTSHGSDTIVAGVNSVADGPTGHLTSVTPVFASITDNDSFVTSIVLNTQTFCLLP